MATMSATRTTSVELLVHLNSIGAQRKKEFALPGIHLGKGTFGEVRKVKWLTRDKEVAMKIVKKDMVTSKTLQRDIMDEISKLRGDHIVRLYDWFETSKEFYMAFEIAEGGELFDQLMAHGRFGEMDVLPMMFDLFTALKQIHAASICHRDLKPENLFIRDPIHPKPSSLHSSPSSSIHSSQASLSSQPPYHLLIADFGACKTHFRQRRGKEFEMMSGVVGSPGYTAPEVYVGLGYDLKVDIWSLGVIGFIMLSGRFPFLNLQGSDFIEEARDGPKYPPHPWRDISLLGKKFISRCLNYDPRDRPTAEEALNDPWFEEVRGMELRRVESPEDAERGMAERVEKTLTRAEGGKGNV